ncbi:MAG: Serine-type D-Ala-D-Ala carboxypeptidase, partial [Candidatus Falkowbacteria bacterium GW2011_GWF2_39_8]
TEEEFVIKMNEKAKTLGLEKTVFYYAVGLDDENVSSPNEVARIAKAAFENKDIVKATLTKKYEFKTLNDRRKVAYSTDSLLHGEMPDLRVLGGKTGYNEKAGYCFVGKFTNSENHEIISVILGDVDEKSRFTQAYNLAEWAYDNYHW